MGFEEQNLDGQQKMLQVMYEAIKAVLTERMKKMTMLKIAAKANEKGKNPLEAIGKRAIANNKKKKGFSGFIARGVK